MEKCITMNLLPACVYRRMFNAIRLPDFDIKYFTIQ